MRAGRIFARPLALRCQNADSVSARKPGAVSNSGASNTQEPEDQPPKRLLWVIPNFRTAPTLEEYKPIPAKEKFKLAAEDSFDRGTVALAAVFAGEAQFSNANRSFGQGVAGYSRYFGTAYADFVIGNYMTEGIFLAILHQDPRYFRKGAGSGRSRLGYAVGQIFGPTKIHATSSKSSGLTLSGNYRKGNGLRWRTDSTSNRVRRESLLDLKSVQTKQRSSWL